MRWLVSGYGSAAVSVVVLSGVVPVVTASSAWAAATAVLADPALFVGQKAVMTGDLGSVKRPVRLERKAGASWVRVAEVSSDAAGRFRLTDTVSRVGAYRVLAPKVVRSGKTLQAWTSGERKAAWQADLSTGATLPVGHGLRSPNGRYDVVMQGDGNLVVYDRSSGKALWASNTSGSNCRVVMQGDGNLVIYTPGGTALWSSQTAPATGARLVMQDDGNLVMYSKGNVALWASYQGRLRNTSDSLFPEATLPAGSALYSRSGQYRAIMQGDGNFVVYGPSGAIWSTGTAGANGATIRLQGDGNLVVYAPGGVAKWSSATAPARDARLVMQDDGNLVMYSIGGLPLWSSRGGQGPYDEDTMPAGTSLKVGQSLWSHDGRYRAIMQGDGNFVVYGPQGATWSSRTGVSGSTIHMQGDGNLVIYGPGGSVQWASSTSGSGAALVMQNDGNLVIYAGGAAKWASNDHGSPAPPSTTGGYPDTDAVDCSAKYGVYSWCKGGNWYHPVRRFAYRNCTDYVAWKRGMTWSQIQYGGSGHAYQWKAGWQSRGRTVGTTPKPGAVAWWGATSGNPYGHVAYVIRVNSDGSAHIGEYNQAGTGRYSERNVRAPYYLY